MTSIKLELPLCKIFYEVFMILTLPPWGIDILRCSISQLFTHRAKVVMAVKQEGCGLSLHG